MEFLEPPSRGLGAVLLEHGLSYDDLMCQARAPVDLEMRPSIDGRTIAIPREDHLVTRIECIAGDAAAITLVIGGVRVHRGFVRPFTVPIPLFALGSNHVSLASDAGPFTVRVTYASLCARVDPRERSPHHPERFVMWRYADGGFVGAHHDRVFFELFHHVHEDMPLRS